MNLSETATLLTMCSAYDRRTIGEADVRAWHALLELHLPGLQLADAQAAVLDHYGKTTEWMMPVAVVEFCKALRTKREAAVGDIYALVDKDPDDPGYHEEYKRIRHQILSGVRDARGELTA